MKNIETIYNLGKKTGLRKKDINSILNNVNPSREQISSSTGPGVYPSSVYGTISIKDF